MTSPASSAAPTIERPREYLALVQCPLYRLGQLAELPDAIDWFWHGFIGRKQITLLTGQWKIGKTALLGCLLARMGAGGQLAGREVKPGTAIVVTEEGGTRWRRRAQAFGIGEHVMLGFRPFLLPPDQDQWLLLGRSLLNRHREKPLDLVVIDPLSTHWPCRDENNTAGVVEALAPIRELASQNVAVLLLHHPRKQGSAGGRQARGSGALSAYVDVLIEMNWYGPPESPDRRRRLQAWSRDDATPREWIIELTADGRDYVQGTADVSGATIDAIVGQLLTAEPNLTCRELLARWPADPTCPTREALNRHLARAVADGTLLCAGAGHRFEPYRYCLKHEAASAM